ncbi:SDR family oxidoreductase [Aquisalimonas asiatica]|uniref:NADP-dependent 3-hydroxy acid dehydrogenase YdfG n=1 Tax=Aquisalimonas asiatica TaxID=406100 RepID=A0A1H8UXV8_9GAMM|nr:SDR family oxidoreductase [Aquisalimonas asiatica]SEP07774.1 NADP-dependent 3-hydroxy acid dehydrogenase YdfG [Aquisalimonas asiatica]
MSEVENKVVIITGASSGLGEATAHMLAKRGAKLMLTARREDRLKQLKESIEKEGGQAEYQVLDVTDRQAVQAVADRTVELFGRIDVLLANAGLMQLAPIDKLNVDEWDTMIDVNIKGVLYGLAAVLPTMRKQGSGHIINLSSVAGHVVFPGAAVYCATKYAVKALSEGIRQESNGEIRATNISPGAVATELTDHITDPDARKAANDLYAVAIDADAIARAVTYAIEQPGDVDVNEMIIRPTKQEL